MKRVKSWILASLLITSGCGGAHVRNEPTPDLTQAEITDSSVDIAYVLGHVQRRIVAEAAPETIQGRYTHDKIVLSEGALDGKKYADFLQKAYQFVQTPRRAPTSLETACRAPFTVTVRIQKDTKISTGCRSADEGALSRLVKDGEFLLYSKK